MKSKDYFNWIILFLVGLISSAQAQEIEVKGNVSDNRGIPLPGASVVVQGTVKGVQTDFDGNFMIIAYQGDILQVSYLGYETQEIAATDSPLRITLAEDANQLDAVVVTALGIEKEKKALGYAVTTLQGFTR